MVKGEERINMKISPEFFGKYLVEEKIECGGGAILLRTDETEMVVLLPNGGIVRMQSNSPIGLSIEPNGNWMQE